jgi:hypothetical protein
VLKPPLKSTSGVRGPKSDVPEVHQEDASDVGDAGAGVSGAHSTDASDVGDVGGGEPPMKAAGYGVS